MSQTPPRIRPVKRAAKVRPGLDMVTANQQASQFPSVGMTLKSYSYDSRDQNNRSTQPTAVVKKSRLKRFWSKFTWKRVLIFFVILIALVGGWLGYKFVYNAHKLFGGNIFSVLHTTKLKGEDQGRVNILLAGNSADDAGHDGAQLTDSIMVLSIDTVNHKAFLLSVPRDLWVHIPNDGHAKINEAYPDGENSKFQADGYPDGGMGELEDIVSTNMGIPIHYYALIDYNAFKQTVDAVGGIDVTIKSNDPRGLYDPSIDWTTKGPLVKLTNGVHHLNGEQALDLSRARGDSYYSYGFPQSDFDRTQHQRDMLVALKTKTVSAGVITNPAKLSSLSDAIGNNVTTDLKLSEVHRLYDLTKGIDPNSIKSLSLNSADGKNLLQSYTSSSGQSALIPAAGVDDFSDIQIFIKKHTSSDPIVQEGATVTILNATEVDGLASKEKAQLLNHNLVVDKLGDAKTDQATTTIIDNSAGKMPATSKLLGQLYGNHFTTINPYAGIYQADYIILLGSDQVPATSPSTTSNQ